MQRSAPQVLRSTPSIRSWQEKWPTHSARCVRLGTMPSRLAPWASAFSTMSPSAALHARAKHGAERVAVVDFDVHHGNGTQAAFCSEKKLFYGSTHQMPLFPGTGALNETGVGNICNAPLKPGDGSEVFRIAFEVPHPAGARRLRAGLSSRLRRIRCPYPRPAGADSLDRARFRLGHREIDRVRGQTLRRQARLDARRRLRP